MGLGPNTLLPFAILTVAGAPSELPSALYLSTLAEPVMIPFGEMDIVPDQKVFLPAAFVLRQ
jgi:hypothetical protein